MRLLISTIAVVAALLVAAPNNANAVLLSLEPADNIVDLGDTVTLDLVISGLTAGAADSLSVFDIDIGFDTTKLTFMAYSLGALLGDLGFGEALDFSFGEFALGLINLSELSLLFDFELDAIQPDTFTLASLTFEVDSLAVGESTIVSIASVFSLGDSFGSQLAVDGTEGAVLRRLGGAASPVPEPPTIALFLVALSLLLVF